MSGVTGSAFAISFGLYAAAGAALFLVFGFVRTKFRALYAPKTYLPRNELPQQPPKLPNAFFSWVAPVLSYDQQQVLAYAGMDALTFVRTLHFGLGFCCFATILCNAAILPINILGDNVAVLNEENEQLELTDLDKFTVANVERGSAVIWVHWVVVHLLSFYIFLRLWKMHQEQVGLRVSYLAGKPHGAEAHTALVTDIPGIQSGTPIDRLGETALFVVPKRQRDLFTTKVGSTVKGAAGGSVRDAAASAGDKCINAIFGVFDAVHKAWHGRDSALPITYRTFKESPAEVTTSDATTEPAPSGGMGRGEAALANRSVDYVAGIPLSTELQAWPRAQRMLQAGATFQQYVDREFEEMFGDNFVEAQLVYDTSDVEAEHDEYEGRAEKLGDMFEMWEFKAARGNLFKVKKGVEIREQPTTRVVPPKFGKWGMDRYGKKPVKLGELDFNIERMAELRRVILEKQAEARQTPAPSAFVTFRSRVQQTLCGNALVHHDTSSWLTSPAPAPDEVVWKNLKWRAWERSIRTSLIRAAFVWLVLFYMVPVLAVQGIISSVNWLPSWVLDISIINAIYTAIVPQLALKIFLLLLPPLLRQMTVLQGRVSTVEVDLGLETKYYGFQYVVLFLTTLIGGSMLSQLRPLIEDPDMVDDLLGTGASTQAIFFTNYVMLETLVGTPFRLLAVATVALVVIRTRLAASERAKERIYQQQYMTYGDDLAEVQITLLLILVFSPIFPIMAPLGVLYHIIAIIVWKYTLCYRLRPEVESGGKLWPRVYWQILIATFSMQLLMTFIISIKETTAPAIAMIPLLVATPVFGYWTNKRFMRPLQIISLRAAAESDMRDAAAAARANEEGGAGGQYVSSYMQFDGARHDELMARAQRWKEIFAGASFDPQEFVGPPLPSEEDDVPGTSSQPHEAAPHNDALDGIAVV